MSASLIRLDAAAIVFAITNLADADVALPLAIAEALLLFACGRVRLGRSWLLTVVAALAVMVGLKLAFGIWLGLGAPLDIRSPSGHVASATVVYGGLTLLLTRSRRTSLLFAALIASLVGATRLLLRAHSVPEVAVGAVVGVTAVAAFGRLTAREKPLAPALRVALVPVGVATAAFLYGHHSGVEFTLDRIELWAARALGVPTWAGETSYIKQYGG